MISFQSLGFRVQGLAFRVFVIVILVAIIILFRTPARPVHSARRLSLSLSTRQAPHCVQGLGCSYTPDTLNF